MLIRCPICGVGVRVKMKTDGAQLLPGGFEVGGNYETPPPPWAKNKNGSWSCCLEHKIPDKL